jgi:alpha-D-ribose 1-methylphosphonate 5-triphosphate diphosphatase
MALDPRSEGAVGETIFVNARIVTAETIVEGSLRQRDGLIEGVEEGRCRAAGALDLEGDFLLPGFIDVHTDHLEKHAMPRPGVYWSPGPAAVAYDAVIAGSGITTVFNALCLGLMGKSYRKILLPRMIKGVAIAREAGLLRADHFLHLRCDVVDPGLEADLEPHLDDPTLRFITILDDSAGRDPAHYKRVQRKRGPISDADLEANLAHSLKHDGELTARLRRWLVTTAKDRGIPVASHDDTSASHIAEAVSLGMTISEFPITMEAALAAHAAGMTVIAGATNIVNGGSHTGNVSVADLTVRGVVQILCSDYVPMSLVEAAFRLAAREDGPSLPQAVAMFTARPASAFGLGDRGVIEPGRRADLVRVGLIDGAPMIKAVWRQGRRVI